MNKTNIHLLPSTGVSIHIALRAKVGLMQHVGLIVIT